MLLKWGVGSRRMTVCFWGGGWGPVGCLCACGVGGEGWGAVGGLYACGMGGGGP